MRNTMIVLGMMLLMLAPAASAYDKGDFLVLDHSEIGFGHACSYYNISNPTLTVLDASSGASKLKVDSWKNVAGYVKDSYVEIEITVPFTYGVWEPDISCVDDKKAGNGSQICTDSGEYVEKTGYRTVWKPVKDLLLLPGKTENVRICGNFEMQKNIEDGVWEAKIDHIPAFGGYIYPEYAWWNATWGICKVINITNPPDMANYTHNITLNSGNINYSKALPDLSDLRFFEGSCNEPNLTVGELGMWNRTVNTSGTSIIDVMVMSPDVASIAMYYNNSAASENFDITRAFIHGDDASSNNNASYTVPASSQLKYDSSTERYNFSITAAGDKTFGLTAQTNLTNYTVTMDVAYYTGANFFGTEGYLESITTTTNGSGGMVRTDFAPDRVAIYDIGVKYYGYKNYDTTALNEYTISTSFFNNGSVIMLIENKNSIPNYINTSYVMTKRLGGYYGYMLRPTGTGTFAYMDNLRVQNASFTHPTYLFGSEETPTLANAPVIANITLEPSSPYTYDNLNCSFIANSTVSAVVNVTATWYLNGTSFLVDYFQDIPANLTNFSILLSGNTTQTDNWSCSVRANDSGGLSDLNYSVNRTILNNVPVIGSLQLDNYAPKYDQDFSCTFQALDSDSDTMSATFYWFLNGALQNTLNRTDGGLSNGTIRTYMLGSGNTSVGQDWYCRVNLTDGFDETTDNTANATIQNYSWPDITLTYPANGFAYSTSNRLYQFVCNDSETAALTATIFINGTEANSTACANNTLCSIYVTTPAVCDLNYWSITCNDTADRSNNSGNSFFGFNMLPAFNVPPTPANGSTLVAYDTVNIQETSTCIPLQGYTEWNGTNYSSTCPGTLACAYSNVTPGAGLSLFYRMFVQNSTGGWEQTGWYMFYTENASETLNITLNLNITKNYTYTEFDDYVETFYVDWGIWIYAILVYGCAFIFSRTYSQIATIGGVGLLAAYIATGFIFPIIGIAGVLSMCVGLILKYVSG